MWPSDSEYVAQSSVFQMKRNMHLCAVVYRKSISRDAASCYDQDIFQEEGMMFKLEFFNLNAIYT